MRHIIPGRGIPSGGVAHRSLMPNKLALRALPAGRRAPGLMQRITLPGDSQYADFCEKLWSGTVVRGFAYALSTHAVKDDGTPAKVSGCGHLAAPPAGVPHRSSSEGRGCGAARRAIAVERRDGGNVIARGERLDHGTHVGFAFSAGHSRLADVLCGDGIRVLWIGSGREDLDDVVIDVAVVIG